MLTPVYAQIEVTTICNFDCYYCAGRDMEQRHMEMDVFARILTRFAPFTGMTVSLQGEGEPTLHPAFWDMARAVRNHGLRAYTITNGGLRRLPRIALNRLVGPNRRAARGKRPVPAWLRRQTRCAPVAADPLLSAAACTLF